MKHGNGTGMSEIHSKLPNRNNNESGPPPGAGRTYSENDINAENAAFISTSRTPANAAIRQLAAERGANTTHPDGNGTGMAFPDRSSKGPALGLTLILLSTLLLIIAARTARHYAALDLHCRVGDVNTINGTSACSRTR